MRYFFDLIDGDLSTDLGGVELESDAAARQEAHLRALDQDETHNYDQYRTIVVRDEGGRTVCKVDIECKIDAEG